MASLLAGCPDEDPTNPDIYDDNNGNNGMADMGPDDAGGDAGTDGGGDATMMTDAGSDAADDAGGDADVCVPETEAEMCMRLGYECGELTAMDNCGLERTITSCGDEATVCMGPDTCGGGDTEGQCGCTPDTCEDLGLLCGMVDDGCDETLTCDLFCVDTIDGGARHACAIGSGKLRCWGEGSDGQLGDGATSDRKNPTPISGLDMASIVDVASGGAHTCVLTGGGAVHCWGDNARGQLGVGTTVDSEMPGDPAVTTGATKVVAGRNHACAIVNGGVKCWGSNDYEKVGNSNFQDGANVAVANDVDNLGANVVDLAAGHDHTCALVDDPADPNDDGSVYCWGRGRLGQLGNLQPGASMGLAFEVGSGSLDDATQSVTPVGVQSPVDRTTTFKGVVALSAGQDHTCARTDADEVYCWGVLHGGSCGADFCEIWPKPSGAMCMDDSDCPGHYCDIDNGTCLLPGILDANGDTVVQNSAFIPIQVATDGHDVLAIDSGANHICTVVDNPDMTESNIMCLGWNPFGQIGDGTNNPWSTTQHVFLDTNNNVVRATDVALGNNHSCALVDNSNVKCWGSNREGQIGNSALMRDESYRPFDVLLE